MRGLIPVGFLFFMTGCVTDTDGPFRQISGHPIDYEAVNALIENRSTQDDVTKLLGAPTSTATQAGGSLQMTYVSIRRRVSVRLFLGVVAERSAQTTREEVVLLFKDGHLFQKKQSYDIQSD